MPTTSHYWDSRGEPKVTGDRQPIWRSNLQGDCPITEPKAFASHFDEMRIKSRSGSSLFYVLIKHQDSFNRNGTPHAIGTLHPSGLLRVKDGAVLDVRWAEPASKSSVTHGGGRVVGAVSSGGVGG